MKLAIVEAVKAFAKQAKANYEEHITRSYNRITSKKKNVPTEK